MSKYKTLKTDIELFAAAITETPVCVVAGGMIVDYGGNIEKYTPLSVKIGGMYYFRSKNEFRAEVS